MSDFQERIKHLSAQQKLLLARRISAENKTKTSGQSSSHQSIVAYLAADEPIETNDLRESLKDKLPEYMIPSKFVQLDELPRLPNGKVDVNLLKVPVEDESSFSQTGVSAPKTENETQLVKIWEEVLGFQPIGVRDNFFEIGGDSILSIQIVAKARQKGIFLAPNQIFEHQTISELALFAKTENKNTGEEIIVGNVPLLPIQHWFFEEHKNAPNHWNQAIMFDVPENLNTDILRKSIECLIEHHDALRLRFEKTEAGWNAFVVEPAKVNAFTLIDLTGFSAVETDSAIEAEAIEIQANQNLAQSALFRTIFFECGQGNKMLLIAHHLLVDNISWQILVSDLEAIHGQLSRDEEIVLSAKTTSYHKWGNHLIELSKSGEYDDEIEFWKAQNSSEQIPIDIDSRLPIDEKSIQTIVLEIDPAATENLLRNSNETYHTKTEELLITALMLGFEKWADIESLCLGLEKHGRKYSGTDLDLSSTIGWFTTYFPVSLKIEDATDFKSSIISIKEKLRRVPNEGIGYGVLRYLKKNDALTQKPPVIFNFLGNQKPFNSAVSGKGKFISKGVRSAKSERHHLLEINAFIEEGRLNLQFSFSEKFHKPETIQNFVELFENALRKLIEHCSNRETSEYSPSDFPEADLNQDDLDNLLNQIN